jgi:bifunctional UDP-N-acetylglucosamine pyrophosphorylase/glucosamine-1-phosphate N-acetyltransferase
MHALLLLAGRSRRFWPLQEKALFPICGKTLLEHQVERLKEGGIDDIILVGGAHNLEDAKSVCPELQAIEQEDLELGMYGALLSALPSLGKKPVLIVSNNDIIEPSAYAELLKIKNADGVILAQKVHRYFPGGYLTLEGNRITGIMEKPGEGKEPSDLVNIVAHVHKDASVLLDALKDVKSDRDDKYEVALQKLFQSHHYEALPYEGSWQAVKYSWHILPLLPLLLQDIKKPSIHKSASVHPTAVVEGNVVIEEGVRVLPHATIVGPCTIGAHSVIGNNALVRGSSVGQHCVVGYNTEVKSSVLANHVWTHSTYIGDSVVAENVSFGAGSVTGNLRLDEGEITSHWEGEHLNTGLTKFGTIIGPDCRIGIHTGINPGVKIGKGTFVSGGTFVTEDIPDESFVRMKEGVMTVKQNTASAPKPQEREKYRKTIG